MPTPEQIQRPAAAVRSWADSGAIVHVSLWRPSYTACEWHGTCRCCEWGIYGWPLGEILDGAREHIAERHVRRTP